MSLFVLNIYIAWLEMDEASTAEYYFKLLDDWIKFIFQHYTGPCVESKAFFYLCMVPSYSIITLSLNSLKEPVRLF